VFVVSGLIPKAPARRAFTVTAVLTVMALPAGARAQEGPTSAEQRWAWYQAHLDLEESSRFRNLPWQHLGPTNISGRMTDVAVVEPRGLDYTIYVAGASGGVWRTRNEGVTWEPILDEAISASTGDVTVAPSDPDVIWVGTGEANIFRSSMAGGGVYKSIDGGDTWEHKGLVGTHTIPRIVVHPEDADIVWVAAGGHEWTANEERGVYKTTDGGNSWEKVLYVDTETGANDLVIDPSNPDRLYASTWQRTRLKWNDPRVRPDQKGSSIFRSEDGGESWTEIADGLPSPEHRGRIGIDVARSRPEVLYAFVDNYEVARMPEEGETDSYGRPRAPVIEGATVFRSDDRGNSWRQTSPESPFMESHSGTYGWVFSQIRVDPNDEDKIYVGGVRLNVSEDQGRTFRALTGIHADQHGLWIDPANSNYLVSVNDGGVDISYDGGDNWRNLNDVGLGLVQFFNVAHDMEDPFHVYGSVQDHGSFRGAVDLSRGRHRIPAVEWEEAPGGEGSLHAIDPTDPDLIYSAGFYGRISRTELEEGRTLQLVPRAPEGEPPYRGQWLAPFILSPHTPTVVTLGLNHVFRSHDRGSSWSRISPDLTHDRPSRIGDIAFQTIFSLAESPLAVGLLYAGTDDGRVWVTHDEGAEWTEISAGLPPDRVIAELVASSRDERTVYMVQNGKRDDDFTPYVWKSVDYGATWESLADGVPSGPANVIVEDPVNPEVLYLGTDLGAYVSLDGGGSWEALTAGLPTTFVHDMTLHPRDRVLVAATHGRGMFAMDVSYIQQLTPQVLDGGLHVFGIEDAGLSGEFRRGITAREAYIGYWTDEAGPVSVVVRDMAGTEVARRSAAGVGGFNAVTWDLARGAGAPPSGRGGGGGGRVEPGTYRVVLTQNGRTAEGTLVVVR